MPKKITKCNLYDFELPNFLDDLLETKKKTEMEKAKAIADYINSKIKSGGWCIYNKETGAFYAWNKSIFDNDYPDEESVDMIPMFLTKEAAELIIEYYELDEDWRPSRFSLMLRNDLEK